jgi:hypothetical protein
MVPASVISGGKINAKVPVRLANTGGKLTGIFSVDLFLNTGVTLDGNQVLVAHESKKLSLGPGKHALFTFNLKSLPAAPGAYHLLAEIVDSAGETGVAASTQTVQVAAPFVALAASAKPLSPATIRTGKSGSIAVTVTNYGNEDAGGIIDLTISASSDGVSPLPGPPIASLDQRIKLKAGGRMTFTLHVKTQSLSAGSYFSLLSISMGANSTTTVGPQFMVV